MVREAFLEEVIFEQRLKCSERRNCVDTGRRVFQAKETGAAKTPGADQSQVYPWDTIFEGD